MRNYALVIKARSVEQARKAARNHNITLGSIADKHPRYDEVIATASVERITILHHWFAEDDKWKAPYPWGTLLYFSEMTSIRPRIKKVRWNSRKDNDVATEV